MKEFGKNTALIDYVNGVSLEFNENTNINEVSNVILNTIKNLTEKKRDKNKEIFLVKEIIPGNNILENFKLIKKNSVIGDIKIKEDFYPILSGEKNYNDITCLMTKKLNKIY